MKADIIILISMSVLCSWLIFCAVCLARGSRKVFIKLGMKARVRCEKCGNTYEVAPEEYGKLSLTKSRSITKTQIKGPSLVNQPNYKYFAKRFYCPHCGEKHFAEILNLQEINQAAVKPQLYQHAKWIILMIIGGMVILSIAWLLIFLVR